MKHNWALVAVFVAVSLPLHAVQRVSAEQLELILTESKSQPDGALATHLSDLQLTERITSSRLARWKAAVAGVRSQRALLGLADRAAFLDLPKTEIPALAAPDLAEQRRIMGLAATYVGKSIPQLPHFYATRSTIHFEDAPGSGSASSDDGGSLYATKISRASVLYRDGQETVETDLVKVDKKQTPDRGLKTWGAFGPVLSLVLLDAAQNKLSWGHWEPGSDKPLAVFRYSVPKHNSHYEVRYCCVAASYGMESNSFEQMSGYHGEMAVDPATGVIYRLTLEAELDSSSPIFRASIAVEYTPVQLGGSTYICPARSVSISLAKTLRNTIDPSGREYPIMGPRQMLLNHVDFDHYHLFRADTRVLSGGEEQMAGLAPDATLKTPAPDAPPSEENLADAPTVRAAESIAAGPGAATPAADPPEIIAGAAADLPDTPAHQGGDQRAATQSPGLTLHINARLVELNVVAVDKKGHPVTDLKPEDFEVYDEGVAQKVSSFNQTTASLPQQSAAVTDPTAALAAQEFSNHASKDDRSFAGGNTVVLLIDGSNLSFPDFSDARQQLLRFVRALAPAERISLYAMRYHGFEVLEEGTTDHTLIASRLAKWVPTAQDIGNAQDEEQRNRQQVETVHNPEDLLSVNGNFTMDSGSQSEALDAKLREMGSTPGPNALGILVDVANHLATLPGHKSLVWVTSDNALADWNKLSITIDKGSKYIEPFALRTQEAMNNAHVSVYPLDASRLEASVTGPEIGRRNVELTPTYERPALLEHEMQGPEATSGQDMNPYIQNRNLGNGSRLAAQMQQDLHPIQGVFREVAEATGGRAFRRSNNMIGELNGVVADSQATYLLGFSPSQAADGKYHRLTVKLPNRRDINLRYRTGYKYDREPTSIKERFAQAVWQPVDTPEIAISTKPIVDAAGSALRVTVAGIDLDLAQQSALWSGKIDIFLVQRDALGAHAKVTGQTVGLKLKSATYQRAMNQGLTFDERIDFKPGKGSLRVIVVDVNSGRMGSVTVPVAALDLKH